MLTVSSFVEHPNAGKKNIVWNTGIYLLASICFERMVYFGISSHITFFFTSLLDVSSSLSIRLQAIFLAAVYISPVLMCYLADTRFGRFNVTLYGHIPNFISLAFCLVAVILGAFVFDTNTSLSNGKRYIIGAFWCIGIWAFFPVATGSIKPNIIVLGGDQFPESTEEERRVKNSFFNALYFSQNIAAFIAFFCVSHLAINGIGSITKNRHKFLRFFYLVLICIGFNILSLIAVLMARKKVINFEPQGSALSDFLSAICPLWRTNVYSALSIGGFCTMFIGLLLGILGIFVSHKNIISIIAVVVIFSGAAAIAIACPKANTWINEDNVDTAIYTKKTIKGYQDVIKTITFLPYSIFFWASYNSMDTTFILQGCQMKTQLFDWYNMPPTQLSACNSIVILAAIPICDLGIYPLCARLGYPLTTLRKIFIGFIFSALGMLVAGVFEIVRKNAPIIAVQASCYDPKSNLIYERDISIMWQTFQFGLIGFSEVFAAVAYFDYFHTENPESLRSITQSLNLTTVSLGAIAGATTVSIFSNWIPDDLDRGHLDYYFFLIAGLNVLNAAFFLVSAMGYTYRSESADDYEDSSPSSIEAKN